MTTGLKPSISASSFCQLTSVLNSLAPAGVEPVDRVLGDDDEQRQVDGVDAFAQDRPLPAALAGDRLLVGADLLAHEERPGVLEVVARRRRGRASGWAAAARRRGRRRSRSCPAGTVTSGTLWMRYCQRQQAEVQAAAEHLGLEAGLAVQGDDPALGHRALRPTTASRRCRPGCWGCTAGPVSSQSSDHAHDQGHQPEHAARHVRQGRERPARPR